MAKTAQARLPAEMTPIVKEIKVFSKKKTGANKHKVNHYRRTKKYARKLFVGIHQARLITNGKAENAKSNQIHIRY